MDPEEGHTYGFTTEFTKFTEVHRVRHSLGKAILQANTPQPIRLASLAQGRPHNLQGFLLICLFADLRQAHKVKTLFWAYRFQEESLPTNGSGEICFAPYEAWKRQQRKADLSTSVEMTT